jgi:SAM-dependent methyltransferase
MATSHWSIRGDDAVPAREPRLARQRGEIRTDEQILEHYLIERELADRLRHASRADRRRLYSDLYDELFRRVPHHPMLKGVSPAQRRREVDLQLRFLKRFLTPTTVFMEIGAGDCALAIRAASIVRRVYAIEVSEQITRDVAPSGNFELILSDGCSIPVAKGSIDVAYSNQLMEHLHPDDAKEQLRNIHSSLAPGGIYLCVTPNRLYGPGDISARFDEFATGFHLLEYTARDIRQLLAGAGFAEVRFYANVRGRFLRFPYGPIAALESVFGALPYSLRKRVADTAPMRSLLGLRIAAIKPRAD